MNHVTFSFLLMPISFLCIQSDTQDCQGSYSCATTSIYCSYTEPCIIHCDGDFDTSYGTCRGAEVEIQAATDLTLNCYKFSDCMDMTVHCGTGDCIINCGIDAGYSDYCKGMNIICGPGVCNINCDQLGVNTCTDVTIYVAAAVSYFCIGADCDGVTFISGTVPPVTTYNPTIAPIASTITTSIPIATTSIPTKTPTIIETMEPTISTAAIFTTSVEPTTAMQPTLITVCVFLINITKTDGNITVTEVVDFITDSINEEFAELLVVNTDYVLDVDVIDSNIITVTLMATSTTLLDKYEIDNIKDATQNKLNTQYGDGTVLMERMVDEYSTTIFNTEKSQITHNTISGLEQIMIGCIAMLCIILLIALVLYVLMRKKQKKKQVKCKTGSLSNVVCNNIEMNGISLIDSTEMMPNMDIMSLSKSLSEEDETRSEQIDTTTSVHGTSKKNATNLTCTQELDDEEMYNNNTSTDVGTPGAATTCGETAGNDNTPDLYVEPGQISGEV